MFEGMPSPEGEEKISPEGKKYEYEKDGVYYGGDYLPEPPESIEVNPDLPPAPPETQHPAI